MPLTVDDIVAPTMADEIMQSVLDLCATGGLPVTSWQVGQPLRTMIWSICQVVAIKMQLSVAIAKGGLGDLTSGDWAKIWAQQIFNVFFIPAAPATGLVKFTSTSPTVFPAPAGGIIVAHRVNGKTYRTTDPALVIPANGSIDNVAIQADEVGVGSNAAPGYITKMVTSAVGVTVNNAASVLGADEETTAALVARSRAKWGSLSPLGPKSAYDYVARTPLDSFPAVNGNLLTPTSAPITRSKTVANRDTGDITVYVANANGAPSGADVALVTTGLQRWAEPWCVNAVAAAAMNNVIPLTYKVWIKSSLSPDQIKVAISNALSVYFMAVDVGGVVISPNPGAVYRDAIEYIIHGALPGIQLVELDVPATDVFLASSEVPVLGTVSPTVIPL